MNTKNRLINRLLKVAKKHKVLTYPVLALVAVISVFSYFFSWTNGAGKRIVAVVMVMVLLVSQSYFLTSSANELVDDADAALVQQELQQQDTKDKQELVTSEDAKEEKTTQADNVKQNVSSNETTSSEQNVSTEDAKAEMDGTTGNTEVGTDETIGDTSATEDNGTENNTASSNDITVEDGKDTANYAADGQDVVATAEKKKIQFFFRLESWRYISGDVESNEVLDKSWGDSKYSYNLENNSLGLGIEALKSKALGDAEANYTDNGCFDIIQKFYLDAACTQEVTDFSNLHMNSDDGIIIYVKRELNRYRLVLPTSYDEQQITFDASVSSGLTTSSDGNIYYVNISKDTGTADFTLAGLKCNGYQLTGASVDSGSADVVEGDGTSLHVSLNKSSATSRTITPTWEGKTFSIEYMKKELNESDNAVAQWQMDLVYGKEGQNLLYDDNVGIERKPGYQFTKWQFADGTKIDAGASIYTYREKLYNSGTTVQLYPVMEYVDFSIENAPENGLISYQYKTEAHQVLLKAKYNSDKVTAGTFEYTINSGDSELAAKGINVTASENGISLTTDSNGPTSVTGSNPIKLIFTVKDANDSNKSKQFEYTISIEPKVLTLSVPDDQKTKIYDGTTAVPDKFPTNINTVGEDGKQTAITVSYTGTPVYNSKDVALADTITIPDTVTLNVGSGDSADNYKLSGYTISGCKITQRWVYLKTISSVKSVLSGMKTPFDAFDVVEDSAANSQGTMGLVAGDTISDLGEIQYTTTRPEDDLIKADTYSISAKTTADSNYLIQMRDNADAKGTFDVIQENPILDKNYFIQAQRGEDDWYTGADGKVVAKADSAYDTVWLSEDGTNFVSGGVLKEEYSGNPNLKIYLTNSQTGAITSVGSFNIKYDITKPQYVGYTVDELEYSSDTLPSLTGKALYFPGMGGAFDFGTYVNSTVTIQVQYESDTSGLNELQYGLFGEEVGTRTTQFNTTNGIATIKVLKDSIKDADSKVGVIRCRAVDRAGNVSDTIVLKPTKDSSDSYEWSVETVGPSMEPLTIYSGVDKNVLVIDQSGKSDKDMAYYNHCQGRLVVTDTVSGINSITWHINGTEEEETVGDLSKKVTSKTFTKDLTAANTDDPYTVYATVRDNAGNEVDTNPVTFKLDDIAPELVVDYDEHVWSKETTISFTTSDDLSGIYYARVTDADGKTIDCDLGSPIDGVYKASFQATKKGQYSIEVSDKAGNITSWTKNITMISKEIPECPTVSFEPEEADGENGWYIAKPTAVLHTVLNTTDGTPVESGYSIWKDGETSYNRTPIAKEDENVVMEDDGYFHIQVWSESASGVTCADADSHITDVKVDTTAPDISFTTEKGSGSNIIVKFDVTDKGSGVDKDSIKILHGSQSITASVEETEDGYAGSFEITETGNYSIQASDLAGNVADEAAFTPMSMKIKAITNITDSTATVGASIYKGTFDISSASISYRKLADDTYTETDAVMNQDTKGNISLSAILSGLTSATNYVYKVTAVSEAGEVLEYEGHFQTLASNLKDGISVIGTARYTTEKEGTITVGLYLGYSCIMAKEIEVGSEFVFEHVPDGNYNVVATDGVYSKSIRVSVQDGMIEYPTQYIDLVLSGKNTSIYVTTPDTPNISADNMDSIFTDDLINFTEDDKALIDAGGTVEFQLCATLMTVSNVSAGEISAMYAVTDKNKIVGAYLDLTLYKIVTEADGTTQKKRVTDLANGANISITIPLGELAGKPDLEVIRIHNDGENFIGASLSDQDNNVNTYTIITNQFSTYAVLYGTGVEPTTEATTQQTTQKVDNNATNKPGVSNNTTSVTTTTEQKADQAKKNGKKNIKDNDKKPQASNTSSIGSLRSSGTAKTGDATSIALLFGLMIVAFGCAGILRRQLKQK